MSLNIFYINLYPLLLETYLLIVICFCLIFGSIFGNNLKFFSPLVSRPIYFFILLSLILSLILFSQSSPLFLNFFNHLLINDSLAFFGKFLLLLFSICFFLIFNYNWILNFEFWILILLSIIALSLLLQAYDLLSIYLILEFLSLTFYILTSMNRISEFSTESGLKYFILGAFASAFLLFGFSLLYSFTGLTNLTDFVTFFTGYSFSIYSKTLDQGIFLSFICIFTAFLFKLGAAPFHFWLPDVYEGAPTPTTAWFALLPKVAILTLFIRFLFSTIGDFVNSEIFFYLAISTLLSSLVGTGGAFLQNKWKRFIAFSSISHLSFFLLILCSLNPENLIYLFIYLFIYLLMSSSFFAFFTNFTNFTFPIKFTPRFFSSLSFLNLTNPSLSFLFIIILFSFAGIPPLAGFFSKFFVLYSAVYSNFYFLLFTLLILNCISCFYYINLIKRNYFDKLNITHLPVLIISQKNSNPLILTFLTFSLIIICLDFDIVFLCSSLISNSLIP